MNVIKYLSALAALAVLAGCATNPRGSVPVTESGSSIREEQADGAPAYRPSTADQPASVPEDSGVVVMVPGGGSSTPIQTYPATSNQPITTGPAVGSVYSPAPVPSTPSGVPSSGSAASGGGLAADEQLDGPVLALLTTAQQQQNSGDLNGAASNLERAQRIAPREPQVLYRLAEVRLAQGDAAQAEQLARRGLSLTSGRPTLRAGLWNLISQARDRQGDAAGAAQARAQAESGG